MLANRDARGRPGRAELSATATLLELARLFRQRDLRKTLVLVSTSGATTGFAGARAWAREESDAPIDAVIVLGDLASREVRKPWLAPWSTDASPVPLKLQRTLEDGAARGDRAGARRRARLRAVGAPRRPADGLRAGRRERRRACPPCW